MTSKEALENIKIAPSFMGGNPRYWTCSQSSIPFLEDINIIKKDLEILEILKNKTVAIFLIPNCQSAYDYSMKTIGFKSLTDKEFMLIKEWLENNGN